MKCLSCLLLIVGTACHSFREAPVHIVDQPHPDVTITPGTIGPDLFCEQSVREFYTLRNNEPFWSHSGRLYPTADSLLAIIRGAEYYGVFPELYHTEALKRLMADTTDLQRLARIDILLTDAYLALFQHLKYGVLDSRSLQRRDLSSATDPEGISSLAGSDVISLRKSLVSREPLFRQYHQLKDALNVFLFEAHDQDTVWQKRKLALMLNLERWRWQNLWPGRYILVNVPAFMMRVMEGDSTMLQTKVIVGKRSTPTPILESVITSFIIYPYWHAPRSIATKEILPLLKSDRTYLERNNFQVLNKSGAVIPADTIQWHLYSTDHFPFILRQREGSENSMGIIRFNFANRYGVYLHDTNSKRLFERASRDLSHGCVRVSKAVDFARYLVRDDDIYVSPEDLDQYLSLRQRLQIDLREPITLKLEYFTAEVVNGQLRFHEDIYKKDSVMLQAFFRTKLQDPAL